MSFWDTRSASELIGILIEGTVSMATRIPLYEAVNKTITSIHMVVRILPPCELGVQPLPEIYLYSVYYLAFLNMGCY